MITKWKLANFKCIKQETELNFAPLTILAGANSSGKSTLLQSILLIAQTLSSKVNSPSVALSGDFVELGQFSDVRSFQGESEPVSIGWECTPLLKHIGQGDWIELEPFEEEISCTVTFDIQGEASSQVRASGQPALFETVLSVTAPAKRAETQRPKSTATLVVKRDVSTSPQPMTQIENDDNSDFKVELDDNSIEEINRFNPTKKLSVIGCELQHFLPHTLALTALKLDSEESQLGTMHVQTPYGIFEAIKYLRFFFAGQVKYLGPLRDKPGFIYPISHNSVDVGTHGQYTAAMLNRYKESQIDYIPSHIFKTPKELSTVSAKDQVVKCSLAKAVIDWLKYLEVAEAVETVDRGKLGYELKVILPGITTPLDLVHVGTGVSQVLPLLVMCLLAPLDSTLIIEQPELHLHPAVQTRLGDFFLAMALSGKQCLIETHSEYLINRLRLRLALAQDDSLNALLKTYFVEKIELESSFREVSVNEYGAIKDWPEGFFDQSQSEAEGIIMASVSKRQARRREKSNA